MKATPKLTLRATLKERLRALERSPHSAPRWASSALQWLVRLRQLAVNAGFRAQIVTRLRHRGHHFQGSTFTREDRYPILFAYAQQQLKALPSASILSFGCSTGEEAFTLARYLPAAAITGVDINPWCIEQCNHKNTNPFLTFHLAQSAKFAPSGPYDAIFCLAVFQRTENHANTSVQAGGFHFLQFAQAIAALDRMLKPGGLLFIDHADFSFADTPTAATYRPAEFPGNLCTRKRPLFAPDETRRSPHTTLPRVFRKSL